MVIQVNHMVKEVATAREQVLCIFQGSGDAMRVVNRDFTILRENHEMENLTGTTSQTSVGRKCYELFFSSLCHTEACTLQRIMAGEERLEMEAVKERKDGKKIFVELVATPLKTEGEITGVIESFRNITERKQMEAEREQLISDLQHALNEVKTLHGLLPICTSCKKIRDDEGYWNQIEGYIQKHSDAKFSHGMCPECSNELYGKEDWYIEMKKEENLKE